MVCQADDIAQRDPPARVMYLYVTVRHGICHGVTGGRHSAARATCVVMCYAYVTVHHGICHGVSGRRRSAARATCGVCVLFLLCVWRVARLSRAATARRSCGSSPRRGDPPSSIVSPPHATTSSVERYSTLRARSPPCRVRHRQRPGVIRPTTQRDRAENTQNTRNTHTTIPSFVYE